MLESISADCLTDELRKAGLHVRQEVRIGLVYDGMSFVAAAIVEDEVLLELKSVENLLAVHEKQTRTDLRFTACRLALLMNFGAPMLKDGLRRYIAGSTTGP